MLIADVQIRNIAMVEVTHYNARASSFLASFRAWVISLALWYWKMVFNLFALPHAPRICAP
jgi:hypothetical protein